MMSEWIDYDGKGMPVPPNAWVEVRLRDGEEIGPHHAKDLRWIRFATERDIVAYRIKEVNYSSLTTDAVNHPPHYNGHPSGVECIDVVEHMGFNLGNAIKYVWRCDGKGDAIKDLKKARWYIEREIAKREKAQEVAT